jgi:DnaD/phage-associated family protein
VWCPAPGRKGMHGLDTNPFAKVSGKLPVARLVKGERGYTPSIVFLFFVAELARQGDGDTVRVDGEYNLIRQRTGISRTNTIVDALQHLGQEGFVAYLGQDSRSGDRLYRVCSTWVTVGPGGPSGEPSEVWREDRDEDRVKDRTDLSSCYSDSFNDSEKQQQESAQTSTAKSASRNPFAIYEDEGFGLLTLWASNDLGDLIDTYGEEAVVEAMGIAVRNNKRNLGYVMGILRNQHTSKYVIEDDADFADMPDIADDDEDPPSCEVVYDGDPAALDCWQIACEELKLAYRQAYDQWLAPARLLAYADGVFTIGVTNDIAKAWLEHRLNKIIVRTLSQVARREVDVVFEVMGRAQ